MYLLVNEGSLYLVQCSGRPSEQLLCKGQMSPLKSIVHPLQISNECSGAYVLLVSTRIVGVAWSVLAGCIN